jgi:hypothetical protein
VAGSGTGNASGLTGFENATGLNGIARGATGSNVGGNLNPALSSAVTTQGRAGGSNGMGNTTSVVPAAPRGVDAGGVAPGANSGNANTGTGGANGTPLATGNINSGKPAGNPSGMPAGDPPGKRTGRGGPAPAPPGVAPSPPAMGRSAPAAPAAVQGFSAAENRRYMPTGLAQPADDGVSTKIVPAKPCSSAARETDGTTTCVGIPQPR